jgi:threonine aldolase
MEMKEMPIDLRSDTITQPTEEMRKAMYEAEVGDDNAREDPTIILLEETAAEMLGKEAALLVTSGTQGNQIAILSQTDRGDEIICEASAHIVMLEAAAHAVLAGVQPRQVPGHNGMLNPDDVKAAIRPFIDPHFPKTSMICVENTHNYAGGRIIPPSNLQAIHEIAKGHDHEIRVHMDGARLFNAVVASGLKASEFTQYVDTVQICLTKGLSAPVGSILAGDAETIRRARHWRKRLGSGMRQAGIIAAPGYVALTQMVDRLAEDNAKAKSLAIGLANIEGITINPDDVETNMVYFSIADTGMTEMEFLMALYEEGVWGGSMFPGAIRFVTHKDVSEEQIQEALALVQKVIKQKAGVMQ